MTQAFTSSSGAKYLNSSQIPTAVTYPTFESTGNRMLDKVQELTFAGASTSSSDLVMEFVAAHNGRILGIRYANGAVAMDGSVGWELDFVNKSNSGDRLAYFGIGSGTEAAKAVDKTTSVAAFAKTEISNSDTSRFNKGDVIYCESDRDGTTGVGVFQLLVSYESQGR